jgi:dTDP-4-amino-4,6-dideoxygalactose transaminase
MNQDKYIVFGKPDIQNEEINELIDSLDNKWLGTGPKVNKFEKNFAEYKGIDNNLVAAVNSCTAGLHLSLLVANIGPGDEVITTAMTFCATVNAIIHVGATPVIVDVQENTFNIDPAKIQDKITKKTKAIIPVHYSGNTCEMDEIMAIAGSHGLVVIEDCAHAIESEYKGRKAGTIGDFGCFSFYATKNITTGEGGMVVAKSKEDIDRIKRLALHGMSKDAWTRFSDKGYKHYTVEEPGYKYNMMDIQAAIGIHQLKRIDPSWEKRKSIFNEYFESFQSPHINLPFQDKINKSAYHLFPIMFKDKSRNIRDQFMIKANEFGVGTGVHYLSIPSHSYYCKRYGWNAEDYPVADHYGQSTVSLPFSPALSYQEIEKVKKVTIKLINTLCN